MKTMKYLGILCMLLLATCLSVMLVSCDDDDDTPSNTDNAIVVTDALVYELGGVYATIGGEVNSQAIPESYLDMEYGVEVSEKSNFSSKTRYVASWKSGNAFRAYVTKLSAQTKYYYRAYLTVTTSSSERLDYYGTSLTFTTTKIISDDNYVDLGLTSGTLWARMNIGAEAPEDFGDFFAWGETTTKEDYSWNSYKWCDGSKMTLTKYCTDSSYGTVDNDTILYIVDDVAKTAWGEEWCMPTKRQLEELRKECTWSYSERNGVSGYVVTGIKSRNSIFIPAAGFQNGINKEGVGSNGYYWSRTLNTEISNSTEAWSLYIMPSEYGFKSNERNIGFCVRPVRVRTNG